jgi:hypothetical protein
MNTEEQDDPKGNAKAKYFKVSLPLPLMFYKKRLRIVVQKFIFLC